MEITQFRPAIHSSKTRHHFSLHSLQSSKTSLFPGLPFTTHTALMISTHDHCRKKVDFGREPEDLQICFCTSNRIEALHLGFLQEISQCRMVCIATDVKNIYEVETMQYAFPSCLLCMKADRSKTAKPGSNFLMFYALSLWCLVHWFQLQSFEPFLGAPNSPCHVLPFSQVARLGRAAPKLQRSQRSEDTTRI